MNSTFNVGDIFDMLVKDRRGIFGSIGEPISYDIDDEINGTIHDSSCIARYIVLKRNIKTIKICDYTAYIQYRKEVKYYNFGDEQKYLRHITRHKGFNHKNIKLKSDTEYNEYIEHIYKKLHFKNINGIRKQKYDQHTKKLYAYYKVGNIFDDIVYSQRRLTRGFYM